MNKPADKPLTDVRKAQELRQQAETKVTAQEPLAGSTPLSSRKAEAMPGADSTAKLQLLHELRVHQIELEMQNEELRRAQLELEAEKERYLDLYDLAPLGYATISEKGMILQANLTLTTLLGVSRSALLNQPFSRFIKKEDQDSFYHMRKQLLAQASPSSRQEQGPRHCETRMHKRDGTEFWALLQATLFEQPSSEAMAGTGETSAERGSGLRVVITDITERKRSEEERLQLEHKLQDAQKLESLGLLAGGIAHDFNNLLTGILGNTCLVATELPSDSSIHNYLGSIRLGVKRAADLCKQMLAYSGRGRFVVQNHCLNQLLTESSELLQVSISKQTELVLNLQPKLPAIHADDTQIRQVIMNLVINASEAIGTNKGVITLSTGLIQADRTYLNGTLFAQNLAEGPYVYLEVTDSGCGMDKLTQEKIFDPFFTTKFSGRGLGLAAVLGIVRSHKGALKIHSEPGQGSLFRVLFPCAVGLSSVETPPPPKPIAWSGQGCVLVVDDDEMIRLTTGQALRKAGFEVMLASNGAQAVEIFRSFPKRFTLVLMDLTMPQMNGRQAFAEMKQVQQEIRVVLMSGYNDESTVLELSREGFASFLSKPFDLAALQTTVSKVLAQPG
jgi:PAS domain S-box-containing protein